MGFNPGDKVRLTIKHPAASGSVEATVDHDGKFVGYDMWNRAQADVEVIQPADDPSKEEVGAVRRGEYKGVMYVVALSDQGIWKAIFCGGQAYRIGFDHCEVVGWEKLEPVDGTPAAVSLPRVRYFKLPRTRLTYRLLNGAVEFQTPHGSKWFKSGDYPTREALLDAAERGELREVFEP